MTSWMREEPKGPTSEEYLLGKAVDKNFEQQGTMGQINAVEYDCTPESIFSSRAEHQVDLQRKLQEDPLMSIKKQELDTRKKLMDNPIKMKQLRDYIEKTKKSKKKKKDKKKKHKRDRSSDDSMSDEDLDQLLLQKMGQFSSQAPANDSARPSSSSHRSREEEEEDEQPRRHRSPERSRNRSPGRSNNSGRRRRSPDSDSKPDDRRAQAQSKSYHKRTSPDRSRRRDEAPKSHEDKRRRRHSRSRTPPPPLRSKGDDKAANKEAEREQRLREMMDNAKWREEQRTSNVKHYREMDELEEKKKSSESHDPDFIRKQLEKAAASGSVEKRIQANRYNIQRGAGAMDQNFVRR